MTHPRLSGKIAAALRVCAACLLSVVLLGDEPRQFSPWSDPIWLGDVNTGGVNTAAGDFFPFVSKDGLSLYFTVTTCPSPSSANCLEGGYGGFDIYVSQRANTDEAWTAPQNLGPTINTPYNEGGPSLSVDGHLMFFASDRPVPDRPGESPNNDIYVTRRRDKRDDFGWRPAQNLGGNINTAANESSAEIFEDDITGIRTLYFDSNRLGGPGPFTDDVPAHSGNDIYASVLQGDAIFGPSTLVAELSTSSIERQPAVRRGGLELYLTSNRAGGFGGLDLWVSTRASTSDPWSPPVNAGPVVNYSSVIPNSVNDASAALAFDGTQLYFQSSRPGGSGAFDLYVSTRTKAK